MGESKRRKVNGEYVSYKGDNYKYIQERLIKRMENFIRKQRGKRERNS